MEQEGGVAQLQLDLDAAAGEPVLQIRHWIAFTHRLFENGQDVLEIARSASDAEPDVAPNVREGERRRRDGAEALARSWAAAGVLRPGLNEKEAADIAWALLSPEIFHLLVMESGWSGEQYETWLVDICVRQLLRER